LPKTADTDPAAANVLVQIIGRSVVDDDYL